MDFAKYSLALLTITLGTLLAVSGCGPIGAPNCSDLEDLSFQDETYYSYTRGPLGAESFPHMAGSTNHWVEVDLDSEVIVVTYQDDEGRRVQEIWEMEDPQRITGAQH